MCLKTNTTALLLALTFCPTDVGRAQDIDTLALSHLARTKTYLGLKFVYDSRRSVDGKAAEELNNELTLFAPLDPNSTVLRRLWVTYKDGYDGPATEKTRLVHSFDGFDGSEGRTFRRGYTSGDIPHRGSISAFDPGTYHDNRIEEFLTGGPHLYPQYIDRSGDGVRKAVFKFRIAGETTHLGEPAYQLEWKGPQSSRAEAIVSKLPGHLTLSVSIWGKEGLLVHSAVESVGTFQELRYPSAGSYEENAVGKLPKSSYEFKVLRVEKATQGESFFPDWPLGSGVVGSAGELGFSKPYPLDYAKQVVVKRKSRNMWMALSVTTLVAIAAFVVWRRFRRY